MSRMRTTSEAAIYLRDIDPGTRVTAWTLRSLIKTGQLPHLKIGNRALLDLDTLDVMLKTPFAPQIIERENNHGQIKQVR